MYDVTLLIYFVYSYGMRYIAKVLKKSLHEKFPDATEDELLKVDSSVHQQFSIRLIPVHVACFMGIAMSLLWVTPLFI